MATTRKSRKKPPVPQLAQAVARVTKRRGVAIGTPRVPSGALPKQRPGRPGGRRDAIRRERVKALCAAGARLFVERGIDGVRVEDVTAAAGVAKGAFYYYFRDLEELATALFAPVAEAAEAAFRRCQAGLVGARDLEAVYQQLAGELSEVMVQHLDVVRLYLQERRGPDRGPRRPVRAWARRLEERTVWLAEEARRHRALRDLPSNLVAHAVLGAAEQVMSAILNGQSFGDPPTTVRNLISLVLEGTSKP